MGRPQARGGKLYPLSMRTTKEIREKLETAAKKNGRSLASEVEDRLMLSFEQDRILNLLRQELARVRL